MMYSTQQGKVRDAFELNGCYANTCLSLTFAHSPLPAGWEGVECLGCQEACAAWHSEACKRGNNTHAEQVPTSGHIQFQAHVHLRSHAMLDPETLLGAAFCMIKQQWNQGHI
eukprot:1160544-Pelagomonas_calceolata.AAC.4